jgi:hypothetical protein
MNYFTSDLTIKGTYCDILHRIFLIGCLYLPYILSKKLVKYALIFN